jgi:hypothetical protein
MREMRKKRRLSIATSGSGMYVGSSEEDCKIRATSWADAISNLTAGIALKCNCDERPRNIAKSR